MSADEKIATVREENATFPCGRNVNVWESCKDCPDYPCKNMSDDDE